MGSGWMNGSQNLSPDFSGVEAGGLAIESRVCVCREPLGFPEDCIEQVLHAARLALIQKKLNWGSGGDTLLLVWLVTGGVR